MNIFNIFGINSLRKFAELVIFSSGLALVLDYYKYIDLDKLILSSPVAVSIAVPIGLLLMLIGYWLNQKTI